ncbi:MAG: CAP domain-containing protein [Candidatus Peribacteraceae bacterium]
MHAKNYAALALALPLFWVASAHSAAPLPSYPASCPLTNRSSSPALSRPSSVSSTPQHGTTNVLSASLSRSSLLERAQALREQRLNRSLPTSLFPAGFSFGNGQSSSAWSLPSWISSRSSSSLSIPTIPSSASSASSVSSASSPSSSSTSSISTAPETSKQRILELVNGERQKANLSPLAWNDKLALAAQRHAEDMQAQNYFSHTGLNGSTPSDRVKAAGYAPTCTGCQWSSSYGENIARGQRTPEQVMNDWMNSPGHRANILNPDFLELGVGIAGTYWAQEFGAIRTW